MSPPCCVISSSSSLGTLAAEDMEWVKARGSTRAGTRRLTGGDKEADAGAVKRANLVERIEIEPPNFTDSQPLAPTPPAQRYR